MGDFKKNVKNDIKAAVAAREAKSSQNTDTVKTIVGSSKTKDKVISAKVYPETWAAFTAINKAQGMTNNSVINMLISEYVRDKKVILDI